MLYVKCPCGKILKIGPKLALHRQNCAAFQKAKYGSARPTTK